MELIARQTADAAASAVVSRWEQQGLAWVDSLNWQQRALEAEARVGAITVRLAELNATVEEITRRDASLRAVEERVDQLEKKLAQAEGFVARAAGSRSALQAMQADVTDLVVRLGERLNISIGADDAMPETDSESTAWRALPPPLITGAEAAPDHTRLMDGTSNRARSISSDGSSTAAAAAAAVDVAIAIMPTKTELQQSASKSTATPERMDSVSHPKTGVTGPGGLEFGTILDIHTTSSAASVDGATASDFESDGGMSGMSPPVAVPQVGGLALQPPDRLNSAVAQPSKADAASPVLQTHHATVGRGK